MLIAPLLVMAAGLGGAPTLPANLPPAAELRRWVEAFKSAPRGPFERIRWFCADGSVQPPKGGACRDHGGGVQHGEWSERVRRLRAAGFRVANLFADLDAKAVASDPQALADLMVERFLVLADEGWIFRRAYGYRGALQAEDEEAGAERLILELLARPEWRTTRFALLWEAARLLPSTADEKSATAMRQLATRIAEADRGFEPLRIKIHSSPDAADARRVADHAVERGRPELAERYADLARRIDSLYGPSTLEAEIAALAPKVSAPLRAVLETLTSADSAATDPVARLAVLADALGAVREEMAQSKARTALALLQLGLALDREAFAAANSLTARIDGAPRDVRITWALHAAKAAYGSGLLSRRELDVLEAQVATLRTEAQPSLERYREGVRKLARAAEWADRGFAFHVGEATARFSVLDAKAALYPQDRLRASPLLFFAAVTGSLIRDANRLAGLEAEIFGQSVANRLRALNPGLARGRLRILEADGDPRALGPEDIVVVPATSAELPPVAGILTLGEGNALSHVQLLARNLGIPNVVVDESLVTSLRSQVGQPVVLAVSRGGAIRLAEDGASWAAAFPTTQAKADAEIEVDLAKLDLGARSLLTLETLRATDSGRRVGPKTANLGELAHLFPGRVPSGVAIPFGAFRGLLESSKGPDGQPLIDWARAGYERIEADPGTAPAFLAELRRRVSEAPLPAKLDAELRAVMQQRFAGRGVFVRSDTNVEDLAGFTGAGLNLTVANVVGYPALATALKAVWASPFTERSYAWRQSRMDKPEHVYPAVLLLESVPSDISGVMVTADIATGRADRLSVAVNEGIGGAVDGQSSEELRIDPATGEIELLARAAAPWRTVLLPGGGVGRRPASGREQLLEADHAAQLIELARAIPQRFPLPVDDQGDPVPGDVEFAFAGGKLVLLQIRPFNESKRARRDLFLASMDAGLEQALSKSVDLGGVP